ncbi:MAG: type II toxin-antitoxin system VapC family toxin [Alphaproteobacteria bacterium]|nr:type II toxin-antitoxin system VapC family toxin [Alphaproteobacteria bacterium]MBF0334505.1 type II toxin-antitoxin system VapC family toxin [Alphaproteobacteria bacterium]
MRLLLDTHILLWWVTDDAKLPTSAKAAIADAASEVFVSAATAWEIAIKQAIGKLEFPVAQFPAILDQAGFTPLGIEVRHAVSAGALPPHHSDPFDRMLVAQAWHEGMTIVTVDPMIRLYGVAVLGDA